MMIISDDDYKRGTSGAAGISGDFCSYPAPFKFDGNEFGGCEIDLSQSSSINCSGLQSNATRPVPCFFRERVGFSDSSRDITRRDESPRKRQGAVQGGKAPFSSPRVHTNSSPSSRIHRRPRTTPARPIVALDPCSFTRGLLPRKARPGQGTASR